MTAKDELTKDELTREAILMVKRTGRASVSMCQRRFKISYLKAKDTVETLERMNIVKQTTTGELEVV